MIYSALIMALQSLDKKQDLVNVFQDALTSKYLIRLKIIVGMIRLKETGINLTWAWQIIIVDPEYTSYIEE